MKANYIINTVNGYFGIDVKQPTRRKNIVVPRQIAMYLCRKFTSLSYGQLGITFSRHHVTVMYGCRLVEKLLLTDEDIKTDIENLTILLARENSY